MSILTPNDFIEGEYKISQTVTQTIDLQKKIDFVESTYLVALFGVELYDLFIIDYATLPLDARFQVVFDAFNYQTTEKPQLVQSRGIKEMLKAFVYYLYVRDTTTRQTTVGIERPESNNAMSITAVLHNITVKYNEGICSFKAIQYYILDNEADYSEFLGVNKAYSHPF